MAVQSRCRDGAVLWLLVPDVAGWQLRRLGPGEPNTIADLHPAPLFGFCTGGH
jgi:hypothetical protein